MKNIFLAALLTTVSQVHAQTIQQTWSLRATQICDDSFIRDVQHRLEPAVKKIFSQRDVLNDIGDHKLLSGGDLSDDIAGVDQAKSILESVLSARMSLQSGFPKIKLDYNVRGENAYVGFTAYLSANLRDHIRLIMASSEKDDLENQISIAGLLACNPEQLNQPVINQVIDQACHSQTEIKSIVEQQVRSFAKSKASNAYEIGARIEAYDAGKPFIKTLGPQSGFNIFKYYELAYADAEGYSLERNAVFALPNYLTGDGLSEMDAISYSIYSVPGSVKLGKVTSIQHTVLATPPFHVWEGTEFLPINLCK